MAHTANTGIAPVDLTSTVGQVRLLLGDTDPTGVHGGSGTYLYFSDAEITAILGLYDNKPKLAAARALETIAGSQALLLKSWSTDDLSVRGDVIAKELRELAKQLRAEAVGEDSSEFVALIQTVDTDDPVDSWWN